MLTSDHYRYLKGHGRAFKMSDEDIAAQFETCGIPNHPTFINFQSRYGGYCPEPDLCFGIVEPTSKPEPHRLDEWQGMVRVRCDVQTLVQIDFWMGTDGTLFYSGVPVAESFERYVHYRAFLFQELRPRKWTWIDHQRQQTRRFELFLSSVETDIVERASDKHHSVRLGDDVCKIKICGRTDLYVDPDRLKKI